MQQFVDRMDEFLEALLLREAMPEHAGACHLCHESIAVWRCRECISPTLTCQSCMRSSHRENPFHRIECWNGSYFRRAELSEVGVYLFIRHYTGVAVCDTLARWSNLLDSAARTKDSEEEIELCRSLNTVAPYHMPDDNFRLCNLELKASAYQFYQLIRRLTMTMAPGEVLDLYRKFRRMARIWRWMKKLKWAGYAGGPNKVKDVGAGELAIFCPACPQPGINIPDNWREDHARHVEDFYLYLF